MQREREFIRRRDIGAILADAKQQVSDLERMGCVHVAGKELIAVQALHEFAASIGTAMHPSAIHAGGYGDAWATLQHISDQSDFGLAKDAWYASPYSLSIDEGQQPSSLTAASSVRT